MHTSVSLDEELSAYVGDVASSAGENDTEAIREVIRHARNLEERVDDLKRTVDEQREEIAELQTNVERLRNEKQQILEQREEHPQLVRAVEQERTLQQRRHRPALRPGRSGDCSEWARKALDWPVQQ